MLSEEQKNALKQQLTSCLGGEKEVRKIVIFGSFLKSSDPHDLDVAVFQDSSEKYLSLAMKYRKQTRAIARVIPLDIVPVGADAGEGTLVEKIRQGEVIYERGFPCSEQAHFGFC